MTGSIKMDILLRRNLPIELVEIICRMVHEKYMYDICEEIKYSIVWIQIKSGEKSFLIGNLRKNIYYPLLDYQMINHKKSIYI